MMTLTKEEAIQFFSDFYGGEHHIPGFKPKHDGLGWSVNHDRGEMATFDFSQLTKLVVMGHDRCIRVGIHAVRNGIIQITIWKRQREGSMSERHPTLEQAVEKIRN